MTISAKLVTAEELLAMPDSTWLELYDGELRDVPAANSLHGNIAVEIAGILLNYVKPRKLGKVLVEGGFVLQRKPDTVLGPDVSFLKMARVPAGGLPEKYFEGAPDLAVEIISPTNPRKELVEKMKRYLAHGTLLGWLVDPVNQTVDVYRAGKAVVTLRRTDSISGEDAIAGFSCGVAEFFE